MKLQQLSITTILLCLLGLTILVAAAVFLSEDTWSHHFESPVASLPYGVLVAAILSFGLGCVATVTVVHNPLAKPVRELTDVVQRQASGDERARARVYGHCKLAELTASFNGLLDQQQKNERELSEKNRRLSQQQQFLEMAGRVALFGGWSVDMKSGVIYWSDLVCDIFEVPRGTRINTVDEAIQFYAPEYRDRIWDIYSRCVDFEEPYDDELVIITANDKRRWVRVTGEVVHDEAGALIRLQGSLQDITARKESEEQLESLSRNLRLTLNTIGEGFFTLDRDWLITYANPEARRLMQLNENEVVGFSIWELFPDLKGSNAGRTYRDAVVNQKAVRIDEYYCPSLAAWLDIRAYPTETGLAVIFGDVSERYQMAQRLRDQEAGLRRSYDQLTAALQTRTTLLNSLPAHIAMLDEDSNILDVNRQWRDFANDNDLPDPRAGVGQNYLAVCERAALSGDMDAHQVADGLREVLAGVRETFDLEYPCHSPEKKRWFSASINRFQRIGNDDPEPGAVLMHIDITERRLADERLNRLAFEDALTGMFSRNGFTRTLDSVFDTQNIEFSGTVVLLDVINQRQVNDVHGYSAGDRLLQQIGHRLSETAGADGRVGRTGGDEFIVYLAMTNERHKLEAAFETPFMIDGFPIETEARFGYTELAEHRRPAEQLLREAELALFQGTGRQKGQQWACFTPAMDAENRERLALTQDLRVAIEQDQLELHFQPKVDMRTGRVLAAEALLRWHHPERGMVSPGLFIPIAEQSQLIGPIGDWVIETACRHLKQWQYDGLDPVQIAVNVSLAQFRLGDFPRAVSETLEHHNLTSNALSLEITESVFAHEEEGLLENLNKLHAMGVRLSLDDFGTGYSSLLYLQKYPFDEIKIDKGFVSQMLDDYYSQEIVRTVIGVADMINAEVVAEGVETARERDALLALGCHVAQGFFYSKPLPEGELKSLIVSGGFLPQG